MAVTARPDVKILVGDAGTILSSLPAGSVQACVTSPPYHGQRQYQAGGIGQEKTVEEYVSAIVFAFRAVRRVLRDDGALMLNMGDRYLWRGAPKTRGQGFLLGKNLLGLPWRVALALQADGWCLRSDIIWHKTNPFPEQVADRPVSSHEHVFLLVKSSRYHFDPRALTSPGGIAQRGTSVWTFPSSAVPVRHPAPFPDELAARCILSASRPGDVVLDPFAGSGTTGLVARRLGRKSLLIELSPVYAAEARDRLASDANGWEAPNTRACRVCGKETRQGRKGPAPAWCQKHLPRRAKAARATTRGAA